MLNKLKHLCAAALAVFVLTSAVGSADAAEVRIRGSTTVAYGLIEPQKARIEQMARVKLDVLPSSTSHGLTDVVNRNADIAMLAESLDTIAAVLNAKQPDFIVLSDYVDRYIGSANVKFIVNPANPVRNLTREQLAGLFSGRIKNWSEVGGNNLPVLVVGEPTSTPHRLIEETLGIAYAPDLRVVQNTNQTAVIVSQAPGAISYISDRHTLPQGTSVASLVTDLKLSLPLHLASRKDAPEEVQRVIDVAASLWVQ